MTQAEAKAKKAAKAAAEKHKADLRMYKKGVADSAFNLAAEKKKAKPENLDILQDLHDRAKEMYAEFVATGQVRGQ